MLTESVKWFQCSVYQGIGYKVQVNSIIKAKGIIKDRLSKQDTNLYQLEILEGEHKGKQLWFAENEIEGQSKIYLFFYYNKNSQYLMCVFFYKYIHKHI